MPISATLLRRWLLLIVITSAVIIVDQVSKQAILDRFALHESIVVVPDLLYITYSQNSGAAFGLLPDAGTLFLLMAVVIVVIMIFTYHEVTSTITRVAIGLVIGGALGNAIDRLHYGYVVDWVHINIPSLISNVSNIADHAIVVGVIIYTIQLWREEQEERRRLAAESHVSENTTVPVEPTPVGDISNDVTTKVVRGEEGD